jgi:hypothetical protein
MEGSDLQRDLCKRFSHSHVDRSETDRDSEVMLTAAGVLLVACQCGGLVVVLAAMLWRPESLLGAALRTPRGLVFVAFVLAGGLSVAAPVLQWMGVPVARRRAGDSEHSLRSSDRSPDAR